MSERRSVIVDGSSLLSICHYTVLLRGIIFAKTEEGKQKHYGEIFYSESGTYINGIFGVLKVTASLPKKQAPDRIAFVSDKTRDTFRRKLYPDYKGTRPATPEPLKQQFVLLEQVLEDAGSRVLYDSQFEADDYAGSLVTKFRDQVPMVVVTEDHDYPQLVSNKHNVRAWVVQSKQKKADELYNKYYTLHGLDKRSINLPEKTFESIAEHVFAEGGVWPCQITDLKEIRGDTSDNIPGIKGVASAASVPLNEYRSVEDLYETTHGVRKDKTVLKELQDLWKNDLGISRSPYKALTRTEEGEVYGKAAAMLFKQLATIRTDIQIDPSLDDFSVSYYDESRMREQYSRLNIKGEPVFGKWHQVDVRRSALHH